MPTLVILCGLPFSGKSFLAKQLHQATGATVVSADEIWRQRDAAGEETTGEAALLAAEARVVDLLAAGYDVVYDTLHNSHGWRDRSQRLAATANAQAVVVYLATPIDVIRQRRAATAASGDRHNVDSAVLGREMTLLEPPGSNENAVVVHPCADLTPLLAKISSILNQTERHTP